MKESSDEFSITHLADVRAQDRIAARVRRSSMTGGFYDARVWAISPFGLEVVLPAELGEVAIGEMLQIDMVVYGQRSSFAAVVVALDSSKTDQCIATVRFVFGNEERESKELRRSPRWLCSDNFFPVAVAPSPAYFDDWMYFQVRNISREGIQLTTSLRNKYLLPGMLIQLSVMFPASGNINFGLRIRRVGVIAIGSRDLLLVGGEMERVSPSARNVIGQYLIQFAPQVAIDELREADLLPESLFRGASIRYVKSQEDYQRVLELRLRANGDSGQLGRAQSPTDMADSDDAKSRILLVTRGEESIATVRIRFPDEDNPLEVERYVNWPIELPRRESMFEVSRLAISSKYRGKDVLPSVFHFISLSAIGMDRPWVTVSAMSKYIAFYEKVGFRRTKVVYKDDRWSDELNVLVGHTLEAIKGYGVSPLYWYVMWSKVLDNLLRDGVITLTGLEKLRVRLYRFLGFVAVALSKIKKK